MSSPGDSKTKTDRALATKYKWMGVSTVVIAVLVYAVATDTPLEKLEVPGVTATFAVRSLDQRTGESVVTRGPAAGAPTPGGSDSEFLVSVPGRSPLPLSAIDEILLVPGDDDPQARHPALIGEVLAAGRTGNARTVEDAAGELTVWVASTWVDDGRTFLGYNTLLTRRDGTRQLGMRRAYREGSTWYTEISPALRELVAADTGGRPDGGRATALDRARIRSVGEINRALREQRHRIVRGQIDALALLHLCFVDGRVTEEMLREVREAGTSLAAAVGLTIEAAYNVAEFGYGLYQEEEYVGSRLFWEAMLLLNDQDGYFHNMYGVSLEKLGRLDEARRAYAEAVRLDGSYEAARMNLARLGRP